MAGRPLEAMALIGLGFRALSMAPSAIGPVKSMILALDVARLTAHMRELMEARSTNLRDDLRQFATAHGLEV